MDVAGTVLEPEDLSGLSQMGEQWIVTGRLAVMGVKAARGPGHFSASADHGAVKIDRQSGKLQLLDLLIE